MRRVFDNFPQEADIVWTPAEWAWIGGLVNTFLTTLACGVPIVASDEQISVDLSVRIMDEVGVTCAVLPPTLMRQMRAHNMLPNADQLRAIGTGGESLGAEMHAWIESTFGVPANEVYGQTENNLVVCQWRQRYSYPEDSMGRATPGFEIGILNEDGTLITDGSIGEIAVRQLNPSALLGYWNAPEATAAKFSGDWLRTGDRGRMSSEDSPVLAETSAEDVEALAEKWSQRVEELGFTDDGEFGTMHEWYDPETADFESLAVQIYEEALLPHRP